MKLTDLFCKSMGIIIIAISTPCVYGVSVDEAICPRDTVDIGANVTILCGLDINPSFEDSNTHVSVFFNDREVASCYRIDKKETCGPEQRDKYLFHVDQEQGLATLTILNIRVTDHGPYTCHQVWSGKEDPASQCQLRVKGVTEAPSTVTVSTSTDVTRSDDGAATRSSGWGLGSGAIIGIVVVCLVAVAAVLGVLVYLRKRNRGKATNSQRQHSNTPTEADAEMGENLLQQDCGKHSSSGKQTTLPPEPTATLGRGEETTSPFGNHLAIGAEAATDAPTEAATEAATEAPTEAATKAATEAPIEAPTKAPTKAPTEAPIEAPTDAPTEAPTEAQVSAPAEKDKNIDPPVTATVPMGTTAPPDSCTPDSEEQQQQQNPDLRGTRESSDGAGKTEEGEEGGRDEKDTEDKVTCAGTSPLASDLPTTNTTCSKCGKDCLSLHGLIEHRYRCGTTDTTTTP